MRFCFDATVIGEADADAAADAVADAEAAAEADADADAAADEDAGAVSGAATMLAGAIPCGSFEHAESANSRPALAASAHLVP
jgi:hypothetical protein